MKKLDRKKIKVPIEVSARHIHLSKKDLEKLFGKNYKLKIKNNLSQKGQFAAKETIEIIGEKNKFKKVRIIGPVRAETQLEITVSDSFYLGIATPKVLISGDLKNSSGGLIIKSKKSSIKLKKGIIVAQRHLHIEPEKAKQFGLKNNQTIKAKIDSPRALVFDNIVVRSHQGIDYLALQLDTDEANAALVKTGDKAILVK